MALGAERVATGQPDGFEEHESTQCACAVSDLGILEEDGPPVHGVGESGNAEGPHLGCATVEPGLGFLLDDVARTFGMKESRYMNIKIGLIPYDSQKTDMYMVGFILRN